MSFTVDPANGMPIQRARELVCKSNTLFKVTGVSSKISRPGSAEKFICSVNFVSMCGRYSMMRRSIDDCLRAGPHCRI
jgi:hypothetical protein